MREIKPHEIWRRLGGIAHEVVMIGPHDGDEQIAHRVAQPHRPERHQCSKGRKLRGAQIQDEHGYENGEHSVGERVQALWSPTGVRHGCPLPLRHFRKSPMLSAMSLACVSSAKWPVSKKRTMAPGISRLNASAPGGRKIGSFLPHAARNSGLCLLKYSWNDGYSATLLL